MITKMENKTSEKDCMIASLHIAMDEVRDAFQSEPDEELALNYQDCLYYLSKIETLINKYHEQNN